MMLDDGENFRSIVASDDRLKARWEAVSDRIVSDAEKLLGVRLSREDVAALPSARLATLTEDALSDRYLSEIKSLESVKEQVRQHELKAALERGEDEALAGLPKNRAKRMAAARELGMTGTTPKAAPTSVADEATLLRRLLSLPRSERLAKARAWNLA